MKKQTAAGVFFNGLIKENPTFVQLLGMCPTLAVTTSLKNGIGMGLSAAAVLVASNVIISLLRKLIPQKVRIAAYIVIIAAFVTMIQMLLEAFLPDLSSSLGIFIPLIVVNCIILARAEAFASKNSVLHSAADGLGIGLGFTAALCLISSVREILGAGTIFDIRLYGGNIKPMSIITLAPGGFIVLGMLVAAVNFIMRRREDKKNG
ncbi:MAG TPA: electron transport complex subunit E [Candidatus Ornithomonoglobus intestinigallinarum]|uniref:Ion-translocating oxidoreductase complex subunit E n=1 Tax=Candidatus Ornithomonoglobus intestinigallinarum TaxID=2840894 RepID=A0A9D1H3B6_9FIRM|nr:electron transport complex subunit E [Candidatus Ornithomonoglobus intestinigallinarum]